MFAGSNATDMPELGEHRTTGIGHQLPSRDLLTRPNAGKLIYP
jgi:hypothetical protein